MPPSRSRLPAGTLADTRGFTRRSTPFFMVRARANGLTHARIAVIVSAKVDRRSAARHLLKRRISERVRKGPGGHDLIITVLPAAAKLPPKKLIAELERTL